MTGHPEPVDDADETRILEQDFSSTRDRPEREAKSGERIQGRYLVSTTIGSGGMGAIYSVTDLASRREIALKQLVLETTHHHYATSAALFEREFQTLCELRHPRVIEVYDYGIDERGPFYTMELLDGGDLRARCPLPWREACAIIYDICSSLALLHSRRLVHRDVSPGNVRCTRDGHAKLIDFGAMVPMGPGGLVVGTAQFVAPEVVHRADLDARTDLFSLGATFYAALTGRSPYPAGNFAKLEAAWNVKPAPPSQAASDIPEALDALVLALIAIEPAMRPRSAFEVMQRLAAIADIERGEPVSVSRAYLSTPVMVGRDQQMAALRNRMAQAFGGRGGSVFIEGPAGVGRSRVLDACAIAAQTSGATVLRASGATSTGGGFHVAATLARQLVENASERAFLVAREEGVAEALFETPKAPAAGSSLAEAAPPRLNAFESLPGVRFEIQNALTRWFSAMSRDHALAIAIDDFHRIDEPSAALVAGLVTEAKGRRLLVTTTVETDAEPKDRLAFDVLAKASERMTLLPLEPEDTERLFESIFGDVPNVAVLSKGVHAIAGGNPRASLDLAEHMVERKIVRYEGGSWTLPTRIESRDLPSSAEEAIRARIAALAPMARWMAEAQALATYQAFTRKDYAKLRPEAGQDEIDRAIAELLRHGVVKGDGRVYTLTHRGFGTALEQVLDAPARADRHRALIAVYEGRPGLGVVRHALLAGLETRALDELSPLLASLPEATNLYETTDLTPREVAATFERALTAAERIGRSAREVNELRRWLASLSVTSDDMFYQRAAPAWLERLKQDSGYDLWQESTISDPAARLGKSMELAFARYMQMPEADRAYRPDEAIKGLAHYVGISLAIGSARIELGITESLPALLEPFAPLSSVVHAIWQNSIAAREAACRSQPERAMKRWREVHVRLGEITGPEQQFLGVFRRAIAHAIGSTEASIGIAEAANWADSLDDDPVQRVSGLHLRRIVRLQQGDWEGAERLRRRAELMSLQVRVRQMFSTLAVVELIACAMARDLTGLKQSGDRLHALAARSPGYDPIVCLAEGHFHMACDDAARAFTAFERGLEMVRPNFADPYPLPSSFCMLIAGHLEALLGLDRHEQARSEGEEALANCHRLEIDVAAHGISRMLALAEAKTGDGQGAAARLEALIADQVALGISGLHLGASYEARTRVAIGAGDERAIEHFAALTASAYRHGQGSPLGARFERLMHEAGRAGLSRLPRLSDFDAATTSVTTNTKS